LRSLIYFAAVFFIPNGTVTSYIGRVKECPHV
jgi:hypothetical protein